MPDRGIRLDDDSQQEVLFGGSYLRLIDSCITQLKAQGPSRTCNESKKEEEEVGVSVWGVVERSRAVEQSRCVDPTRWVDRSH